MLTRLLVLCLAFLSPALFAEGAKGASTGQHFPTEGPELRGDNTTPVTAWQLASGKKWEELSEEEKKRIHDARDKYRRLPPEKQEELRRKWEDLPDRKKERYRLERERKER